MDQDTENKNIFESKTNYKFESQNSFVGFFIKNFRFSYLIIMAIFILGAVSLATLPRESDPEVKIPYALVTTIYSGTSPEDIEKLITDKIESKLDNLENVKEITSNSATGVSSIFVQFDPDIEINEAIRKLRDSVETAKPDLPKEANDPMVTEIRTNDFPIITFSLFGNYSNSQLQDYADLMKKELESIKGVSKAPILGELKREFQITIDKRKIQGYGLDINTVVNVLSLSNIDMPLGNIKIDGYEYNIRTEGRFTEAQQLNDIIITYYNNQPIYLKDISDIKDNFREKTTISKLGIKNGLPQNTMSLQVYKKTGGNILKIVDDSRAKIQELKDNKRIPEDLDIKITNDNSIYIRKDLNTLGTNAIQTIFLIILIIFIAMGWKESSLAIFVIPLTFLISFAFLKYINFTLNSMTTFSLVLSLGLLIDTAIVVMEGIFDAMEHKNMNATEAALHTVATFKWPLISGTMTTIAAFVPMLLVSGIMGDYLKYIPITVSFTLFASLFISLTILPTLASRILKKKKNRHEKAKQKEKTKLQNIIDPEIPLLERLLMPIKEKYANVLLKILKNKKQKRSILLIFTLLFFLAVSMPIFGLIKIEMFPTIDFDYFYINIEAPVGTVFEETNKKVSTIEEYVMNISEIENYVTTIGASQGSYGMSDNSSSKSNLANITVNLVDEKNRKKTSYEIAQETRDYFEKNNHEDIKITVPPMQAGPPSGSPVELRVSGEQLETLTKIANDIKQILSEIDGTRDTETDIENTTGQFVIQLDQKKLSYYNLNVTGVAMSLRQIMYGVSATEISKEGKDIELKVGYDEKEFKNIEDVKNILINSPKGQISLASLSTISFKPSVASVKHKDSKRIINIASSVETGKNANTILKELQKRLQGYNLPENYYIDYGGESEDIQQSYTDMFTSLIVAVILIASILILQFNSFKQPFIIMFMLPLSLIGVILGLTILRLNFNITSFIGVVSLAGIVVNDAIILISKINENIRNCNMDFYDAIHEATVSRLQPIILTTATTVIGLLPLALSDPMWAGLSYSIIFGLTFATLLTLFIVPIMYTNFEYKKWNKNCMIDE
ncbi:MAG: efflux RND transporter permease subunit [Patescibacteria group bacterium]|nr:efflux RND transporter permease subunit [Patescibacteria group bacterium]MDD4304119.1 efflux RND transporter permease subunit [Patescibacteria group bacterium]MDD4694996.1 efflux RND transporter permease subunit [Patescibacteria group bacterium]